MAVDTAVIPSPIGPIAIDAQDGAVIGVRLGTGEPLRPPGSTVLEQAAREIAEYFGGRRRAFTVPLRRPASSTIFQERVWDELERIPAGETRTYGEVGRSLGTSPRAVGGACARNAIPLFIPCHRVVAAGGLGGFSGDWEAGAALMVKKRLLEREGVSVGSTPRLRS